MLDMSTDTHAVGVLEGEVRELVRRRGVDPARDRAAVDQLVRDVVADYETRSALGAVAPLADPAAAGRAVVDAVAGLGPLQPYLDDPEIEEIWINAPSQVFVARGGSSELTTTILTSQQVRDLVEQMLRSSGRRLDLSSPFVDACLPGGERLHVVIPDVTRSEWAVNIRKHVVRASHLDDLVRLGALPPQAAAFLDASVRAGLNILVAGATQAEVERVRLCHGHSSRSAVPPHLQGVRGVRLHRTPTGSRTPVRRRARLAGGGGAH